MRHEFDFPEGADVFEMKEAFEAVNNVKVTAFLIRGGKIAFICEPIEQEPIEPEPPYYDYDFINHSMFDDECKMCGKERNLNNEGYCSPCWQIWNS